MSSQSLRPNVPANQRRTQRILLSVALRVSGKQIDGTPFVEHTNTLIVNADGALLQLRQAVHMDQALSLRNISTGEEEHCTVVDVNEGANGVPEVGVEFAKPNSRFWRVSFPPADWSTRSPEAKRYASSPSAVQVPVKLPASKK